jgi:hypothetical protein
MKVFRQNLSDERGIALPVALAVLFVVAGLATVAARSAIVTDHQSFRDRSAKSAIQAAQSGLRAASYELNMLQPGAASCVGKDTTTGALSKVSLPASGWCEPETETLGDGASYSVSVSGGAPVIVNGQNLERRTIVATGTTNGIKRRATYAMDAATGSTLFPRGYAMIAKDSILFKNNTNFTNDPPDINGGIASNGDIIFKNNTSICGPVTPGPGKSLDTGGNFSQCAGAPAPVPATQPFPFQPVDMSGANSSNQNVNITRAVTGSSTTPKDTCSNCSQISWNSTTRVLSLTSNSVLTLTGDIYSVCSLSLGNNAQIQVAARTTPLYFYIDSPENCGGGLGMGSATLAGQVVNVNASSATFVLLVAGSVTKATTVSVADNTVTSSSAPMAIYAPNSTVDYTNDLDWKGVLMAKNITIKNNATISYDDRVADLKVPNSTRLFEPNNYRECANDPTTSTDPSSGC